jgi:hypothetical protein
MFYKTNIYEYIGISFIFDIVASSDTNVTSSASRAELLVIVFTVHIRVELFLVRNREVCGLLLWSFSSYYRSMRFKRLLMRSSAS